jgi:hypothetical protein
MQKQIYNGQKALTHRVITMLGRKELDFLDKLGKDALFSTGHKLSYNEILRALIEFAMQMGISGDKVDSAEKLKALLLQQSKGASAEKGGS